MTDQRVIIEMGMGNDQYGMDYTKAAERAIEDAIRHSSLSIFKNLDLSTDLMRVVVTIGVQNPEALDTQRLIAKLPYGTVTITAIKGGLDVHNPHGDGAIVVASAAVEVFLPDQSAYWQAAGGVQYQR